MDEFWFYYEMDIIKYLLVADVEFSSVMLSIQKEILTKTLYCTHLIVLKDFLDVKHKTDCDNFIG